MEFSPRELNLIWLDLFNFMTHSAKTRMLKIYGFDCEIRKELKEYTSQIQEIISLNDFNKMMLLRDDEFLEKKLKEYQTNGVSILTIYSEKYPALLRETDTPPYLLYCKGNIDLLNSRCFAIVGARSPSDYGRVVTKQFANALAKAGLTIVSGFAFGVDNIVHEEALAVGGNTIAVLAGGFEHIYPAVNYALAEKIAQKGLLVCEHRPDVSPLPYMFPIRNRILAGLSEGVLITEAKENSGSLYTKNYALDYNRDIFVIPGKITSIESKGCNKIIKDCQGAICLSPDEILEKYDLDKKQNSKNDKIQLDFLESNILRLTSSEKISYQELLEKTELPAQKLNAILLGLQVHGMLEKLPGNYYISN